MIDSEISAGDLGRLLTPFFVHQHPIHQMYAAK